MKKTKVLVLILITILLIIFPLTIDATYKTQIDPDDYSSDGPSDDDVEDMYKFGGRVAGVVQIVGTIVSVGALMIIGIRYVVASAEEKAEYKERMLPYIIGAVLLFGATNIVNLVYKTTTGYTIHHSDPEWEGQYYDIECQNVIIEKVGPITNRKKCGGKISIPIPQSDVVKCNKCQETLYNGGNLDSSQGLTANAKVVNVN